MPFDDRFALGAIQHAANKGDVHIDEVLLVSVREQMFARSMGFPDLVAVLRSGRHAMETGSGTYFVDGEDTDGNERGLEVRLHRASGGALVIVVQVLR
jgi:hypothetical protein